MLNVFEENSLHLMGRYLSWRKDSWLLFVIALEEARQMRFVLSLT